MEHSLGKLIQLFSSIGVCTHAFRQTRQNLRARVYKIDKSDDVIIKRLQRDPEKEETSVFSGRTNVF